MCSLGGYHGAFFPPSLSRSRSSFILLPCHQADCITTVCSGDFLNLPSHYRCCKLQLHLALLLLQGLQQEEKEKDDRPVSVCLPFTIIGLHVLPVQIQTTHDLFEMQTWLVVKSESCFLELIKNVFPCIVFMCQAKHK